MLISEASGVAAAAATERVNEAALGQEDFLRMLIAQLENQDPLNPQDGTEFTAQLAQFSSLEQQISMRNTLEGISSALSRSDSSTAIDLIGKQVLVESPYFNHDGGPTTMRFNLAGASEATQIELRNASGQKVQTLDVGGLGAGDHSVEWDGLGRYENSLPPGVYTATLVASAGGNAVSGSVRNLGIVSGADLSGFDSQLYLGDIVVPLASVLEVRSAGAAGTNP